MSTQFDKLEKCYEYCKTVTDFIPRVGLILGSGLGGYAKNMKVVKEISYDQIPGFPVSTVQGHDGKFLLGYIGKVPAMVMKGRVTCYEGTLEDRANRIEQRRQKYSEYEQKCLEEIEQLTKQRDEALEKQEVKK